MATQEGDALLHESQEITRDEGVSNPAYQPVTQRGLQGTEVHQAPSIINVSPEAAKSDPPALTFSKRRARFASSLALFLYAMGSYPSQVVTNQYLVHRWSVEANVSESPEGSVCFRNSSDPRLKEEDDIQARVSDATMYYSYVMSFPAVVSSILMGTYSDVIGRRTILLIPLATTMLKFLSYVFIVWYDWNPNYFFIGNAVEGVGGSYFVVLIASFSITADLNEQKGSRVLWINILVCGNQLLAAIFTTAVGYVIDNLGFVPAYVMILVPISVAFSVTLFFLPETRPKCETRKRSLHVWSNVGRLVRLYTSEGSKRQRQALFICLLLFFFGVIDILNGTSIDSLFQLHPPLCWTGAQIGYYETASQGGVSIAGVIYQSVMQRYGCLSPEKMAMLGMLFQGGGYVMEAFVKNAWMMYSVTIIQIPAFPVVGIIRGIMSLLAGPFNQGTLFASIAVVEAFCSIASNTALYRVYSATVDTMVGAVFLLMAGFCFLNFFLFFVFFHYYEDPSKADRRQNNSTIQADKGQESNNENES